MPGGNRASMLTPSLKRIWMKLPPGARDALRGHLRRFWRMKARLLRPYYLLAFLPYRHKPLADLTRFEQKVYSENGEDGMLWAIFRKIGTTNRFCVEFGAADGYACNTGYLTGEHGWDFLRMDACEGAPPDVKKEFVTAENINDLFRKYDVPQEFDLLSIDIDYNDYWVWKAITGYRPRVVVIEYNASVAPAESRAVEYDPDAHGDGTNYFGASLLAMSNLGREKGYALVGCNSTGVNAFFVREDLVKGNFDVRPLEALYRPPAYGQRVNGK